MNHTAPWSGNPPPVPPQAARRDQTSATGLLNVSCLSDRGARQGRGSPAARRAAVASAKRLGWNRADPLAAAPAALSPHRRAAAAEGIRATIGMYHDARRA